MIVNTEFDGILEEDVIFEETDESPSFKEILKNSENLLKSFLYMKKMFNTSPMLTEIIDVNTIETSVKTEHTIVGGANMVMVKNISSNNLELYINNGLLVLLPFESFELPIKETTTIAVLGNASIVQSKYIIG